MAVVSRILFGLIFSGSLHLYVWQRATDVLELGRRQRRILGAVILLMMLSIPLTTSMRLWAPGAASVMAWIALPWLAFVGLATVALFVSDLPRLVVWLGRKIARKPAAVGLSRREFLSRVTGGTALVVAGASVGRGVLEARGDHEVVTVEVALSKLPKALDGFSIVQLSDLHTGMTIDREFVQRVVDRTNALQPDLIALTGDLVDGPVASLRDDVAPLAQLHAPHGVFAVTGNHEYYAGVDEWIAEITKLGATYLRNQHVAITKNGATFDLGGVDDHSAHEWPGHGENFPMATAGRDPSRVLVMLAHQPRQVRHASDYGVDLQLSGHTHGGQIWPWHYIVKVQQGGLLAGSYEHGGTKLYVTRGCGYWGPPVRLLAPLEITRIILRTA